MGNVCSSLCKSKEDGSEDKNLNFQSGKGGGYKDLSSREGNFYFTF